MPLPSGTVAFDQPRSNLSPKGSILLKKIRCFITDCDVAEMSGPLHFHRPVSGATLATHDDPVDSHQVRIERTNERLCADKFHSSAAMLQCVDAVSYALIFNTGTHPHVVRPSGPLGGSLWPLSEALEHMLLVLFHRIEYAMKKCIRHLGVEHIAHAIREYSARLLKSPREVESVGMAGHVFSSVICRPWMLATFELERYSLGVAVSASIADFGTSSDGVPCFVSPTNNCRHVVDSRLVGSKMQGHSCAEN